jgi:hypothetical protein
MGSFSFEQATTNIKDASRYKKKSRFFISAGVFDYHKFNKYLRQYSQNYPTKLFIFGFRQLTI